LAKPSILKLDKGNDEDKSWKHRRNKPFKASAPTKNPKKISITSENAAIDQHDQNNGAAVFRKTLG